MPEPPERPRQRHLLDLDNPRQQRPAAEREKSLGRVQRWVMSVLAVTTILHLAAGIAIAAIFMPDDRLDARIGLNVIAGGIGIVAAATGRLIHQKSPLSPWLLLGITPGLVGAFFTFR
jgi:hypothetical protein